MRKLTALIVASTVVLGSASMAYAADTTSAAAENTPAAVQQPEAGAGMMGHHRQGKWDKNDDMFKGLNLTEQQRQQMRAIRDELRKERPTDMMQMHQSMHALITADKFDETAVQKQIDAMSATQSKQMLNRVRAQNKMYNLLTPEQKKIFNERYQQRQQKMMEHHKARLQ